MPFYKTMINNIVPYPGIDIWYDDVFNSKFNILEWKPEFGGTEFDIPGELIPKPYQTGDFEISVDGSFILSKSTAENFIVSSVNATTLTSYFLTENALGKVAYLWLKYLRLEMTGICWTDGSDWFCPVRPTCYINPNEDEHDFINMYWRSGDEQPIVSKYCKTFIGCKVRIYDGDNVVFGGRISETPTQNNGLVHFTVKDEIETLDIPIPKYDQGGGTPNTHLFKDILELDSRDFTFFQGEIAWLKLNSDTIYELSTVDTNVGGYETFIDFLTNYLQLKKKILILETYAGGSFPVPRWKLEDIATGTPTITLDIGEFLNVAETIKTELSTGISMTTMEYLGLKYVLNNVYSINYGTQKTFEVNVPAGVTIPAVYSFTAQNYMNSFMVLLGIIYQKVIIPTDSRAKTGIIVGTVYAFNDWSLDQVSTFIDKTLSNKFLCITNTENVIEFLHVK